MTASIGEEGGKGSLISLQCAIDHPSSANEEGATTQREGGKERERKSSRRPPQRPRRRRDGLGRVYIGWVGRPDSLQCIRPLTYPAYPILITSMYTISFLTLPFLSH